MIFANDIAVPDEKSFDVYDVITKHDLTLDSCCAMMFLMSLPSIHYKYMYKIYVGIKRFANITNITECIINITHR